MNIKINYQAALQNQIKSHQQAVQNRNELKKRFQYAKNNINKLKSQCVNKLKQLNAPQQLIQSFNFIKDYKSAQKCYQYLKNFDKFLSKDKDRNRYMNISYPKIREINKILMDLLDVYSGIGDDYQPINLQQVKLDLLKCGQKAKQILFPIVNNLQGQLQIIVQSTDSVDIYVDNNRYLLFSIWDINNQQIIQNIMQDAQQEFKDDESVPMQSVNKYIQIISRLKNRNKKQKILTLYTARPMSHRKQLSQMQGIPNGVYLTNDIKFAQGFGADYGEVRDIWQVKISNKYVLQTLSDGYNKQYRIVYNGLAPCEKKLLQIGQKNANNWYSQIKIANKIIAYHVTDTNFNKFNLYHTAQGILWFTTDKNSIINRTTGSHASKIILTCQLNINKTAGWNQYQKMGIWQLKRQGFDSVKLDQNYIIFDPKNVKIIKRENNIKTAQKINFQDQKIKNFINFIDLEDSQLPKQAQQAITAFVGHQYDKKLKVQNEYDPKAFGIMREGLLQNAYSETPSDLGKLIKNQLQQSFNKIKPQLIKVFGDKIPVFRYQRKLKGGQQKRNVLSFTLNEEFANYLAQYKKLSPISDNQINNAINIFNSTGQAKLRQYTYIKQTINQSIPNYSQQTKKYTYDNKEIQVVAVYTQSSGRITDYDNIEQAIRQQVDSFNQFYQQMQNKKQTILSQSITIDQIVWITDRANQLQVIVKQ